MTDRLKEVETGPATAGPASAIPTQLRSRRAAGYRTAPRTCGCPHAFHSDPLDCDAAPAGHSDYGLTPRELWAEYRRLRAAGWTPGEVRRRLCLRGDAAA
ncbi:hypothetical protein OHB56_20310 [Streptomyces sp. NBC_01635]|uniref:hypothetical protein n=1 Tax=Streptomyces sp. NBC_01635 TaxID=2975904 RepID=UPI003863629D|nr:hypothetical protein OHB56_20310 [Streptomyces sp. NBC_01635]